MAFFVLSPNLVFVILKTVIDKLYVQKLEDVPSVHTKRLPLVVGPCFKKEIHKRNILTEYLCLRTLVTLASTDVRTSTQIHKENITNQL